MRNLFSKLHKKPIKQKGFSLIELSVIISVAASAIVGYLSWTQPKNIDDAKKTAVTRESMKTISRAIEAFVIEKGRLPCPADPYMRIDNTRASGGGTDYYVNDYGMEDLDTSDTLINGTKTLGVDCPTTVGAVPVYSLGLGKNYINDGWGRRFTYSVASTLCGADAGISGNVGDSPSADLTSRQTGCTAYSYNSGTGNLTVTNGSTNITTTAAYVIVSHGANGNGGYFPSGTKQADSANANELENSDADTTFVQAATTSSYDDLTMFKTKIQVDRLNNSEDIAQVSIAECEANSTALKNITLTASNNMSDTITSHLHGATYNSGDQVALGVMMAYQNLCVKYYGVFGGVYSGWSGAQCPGNNNPAVNGTTYTSATNSCTCKSNLWDGNCTGVSPADTANLSFWLDAADSATVFTATNCTGAATNGSSVACWKDKSTNAKNVTQGTAGQKPLYVASVQNSLNIIRFDGSNDTMATASTAGSVFFSASAQTGFIVHKSTTSSGHSLYWEVASTGRFAFGTDSTNSNKFTFDDDWWNVGRRWSATSILNRWCVMSVLKNASNDYIYDNGTLSTSSANASTLPTGSSATLNIGSAFSTGQYPIGGDFAEIIIYKRALTAAERVLIERYLGDKWAITVN